VAGTLSKANKLQDRRIARAAAYGTDACPFEAGSRLARYYATARQRVDNMNAIERDLASVYGPLPPRNAP